MELWISLVIVGLIGFLASEWKESRRGVWFFKSLASMSFVAAAFAAGALSTDYGLVVFVGLILCWGGDVLLIPKSTAIFKGGIISFLLGHMAYVVAFFTLGVSLKWAGLAAIPVAISAAVIGRWIVPRVGAELRGAVLAYIAVISVMVCCAVGTWPDAGILWIPVAATAFFFSDISVAIDRFVSPSFSNRLWGLPLYYGAQICFVLSL